MGNRVKTVFIRSVAIENIAKHKASMAKRGWTFDRQEALGNGCLTHVWLYYRKPKPQEIEK